MRNKEVLKNLRLKTIQELELEKSAVRREVFDARLELSQGRLKDVKKMGGLKRRVAQILTIIQEKKKDEEK